MYPPLTLASKYLRYYFTAANGKGHGIHSPFVFELITNVLNDDRHFYAYKQVEDFRARLKQDQHAVRVEDLGAGSAKGTLPERRISDIVRSAAKSPRLAKLLFRVAEYYKAENILELGTSLGITTSYLALARPDAEITTIEGVPAIAARSAEHFRESGMKNIRLLEGNFDAVLPAILPPAKPYDMVYIDGNHRYEPTLRYFRQLLPYMAECSIMIFDDIHWSNEMEQAWAEIRADEAVMLTVDLFFIGLVFFRKEFKVKQNFVVRF